MLATPLARSAIAVAMALLVSACSGTTATPSPTVAPTTAPTAAPTPTPTPSGTPAPTPTPRPTVLPAIEANTTKVALTKIPVPPDAGKTVSMDIFEIDQDAHLLYIADRLTNGVDIFDIATPAAKFVKAIDAGSGANGITVAKNVNKLYAGLNDGNIAIIDIDPKSAKVNTVIVKLASGGKGRADEMDYDPKDKKLYVANSNDGIVNVIDGVTDKIIKKFENLGDGLEQPRYNASDGMMYMTASDQNAIFQFDPRTDVMVKKFDVVAKCNPNGLAINPTTNQALLGCSAGRIGSNGVPITVAWDLATGKALATFEQAGAGDSTIYDPKIDRFFFGAHNFNRGSVIAVFTGSPTIKFVTNVPMGEFAGSKNLAYDQTNDLIYTQDGLPGDGSIFSFKPPR